VAVYGRKRGVAGYLAFRRVLSPGDRLPHHRPVAAQTDSTTGRRTHIDLSDPFAEPLFPPSTTSMGGHPARDADRDPRDRPRFRGPVARSATAAHERTTGTTNLLKYRSPPYFLDPVQHRAGDDQALHRLTAADQVPAGPVHNSERLLCGFVPGRELAALTRRVRVSSDVAGYSSAYRLSPPFPDLSVLGQGQTADAQYRDMRTG